MSNEYQDSEPLVVDVDTLFQQFEELVDRAGGGQEILITKEGEPFAKLVPPQ